MRILKLFVAFVVLGFAMNMVAVAQDAPATPAAPAASAAASPAPEATPAPAKQFVCEKCSITKDAPGKCEKCGGDLTEKVTPPAAPAPEATPATPAPEASPAPVK